MENVKKLFDLQVAKGSPITHEGYEERRSHRIAEGRIIPDWLNESIIGQNIVYFLNYNSRNVEILQLVYPLQYEQFTKDYIVYGEANTDLPKMSKLEPEVDNQFNPGVYTRSHD